MNLSDEDIKKEIKNKRIVISPKIFSDQISPGSIDLTLSDEFWVIKKKYQQGKKIIDLKNEDFKKIFEKKKAKELVLLPYQMCLGITKEKIKLPPDIMGRLEGRSRYARMGLAVHITSSLVQPGSENRQVLEIVNLAPFPLKIHHKMRISQICLSYTKTPTKRPYKKVGKIAKNQ
ncbi:MAG: dCTP deaminase [Candidatus Anstonellaceae archaeon]